MGNADCKRCNCISTLLFIAFIVQDVKGVEYCHDYMCLGLDDVPHQVCAWHVSQHGAGKTWRLLLWWVCNSNAFVSWKSMSFVASFSYMRMPTPWHA